MSEITERLKTAIADRYLIEHELGQGGMATFYWSGGQMTEATVQTSPTFAVTGQHTLFVGAFARSSWTPAYDIAPDGRHFVVVRGGTQAAQAVVVAVNWFTELRERMAPN